jgi:hypothetical protein
MLLRRRIERKAQAHNKQGKHSGDQWVLEHAQFFLCGDDSIQIASGTARSALMARP